MSRLPIIFFVACHCAALFGQTTNSAAQTSLQQAPGAPGNDAHWPSAAKNGFGTSNTLASNVWFTLNNGVMTEVFYPTLDIPNSQAVQFVVCRARRCETESEDMSHQLVINDPRALSFTQINRPRDRAYTITKTYITDPDRPVVLIDVAVVPHTNAPFELYLHYDPSLNNSGRYDTAWSANGALFAVDNDVATAIVANADFLGTASGFVGSSDGLTQLRRSGRLTEQYLRAENGNVAQVAKIGPQRRFQIALGFGSQPREAEKNARTSLQRGFLRAQREYHRGWHRYLATLRRVPSPYQTQYQMAALVLKGLEDKTHRGAMIASPSNPWGAGANANEPNTTGYHAVWARDLYHIATAFHAMGDRESANRALDYLLRVQQKPDGGFPQNSRVDGRIIGGANQMDQVGLALLLASQLGRTDRATWQRHIKPAADFLVRHGPVTEQERWEEERGYSPSSIAAEIAGLVAAARIAGINEDDTARKLYLETADRWLNELENWTATSTGPHAKTKYFFRINQNHDPNDGEPLDINSGGGVYDERSIVDAGFLELVRLGIYSPRDPVIKDSVRIVDRLISANTQHGQGWYRYNHDAYGERADGGNYDGRSGKGRLWALLTGERGEYELALGQRGLVRRRLRTMIGFANDGRMIPEQIWDKADIPSARLRGGEGTGSATPLAWSMAQYVRLVLNLQAGRNLETPPEVLEHFRSRMASRVQ